MLSSIARLSKATTRQFTRKFQLRSISRVSSDSQNEQDVPSEGIRQRNKVKHVSLISGASRGIGLAFTRKLLEKHKGKGEDDARLNVVIGCCRNPETSQGLKQLLKEFGNERLKVVRVDVLNEREISQASEFVEEEYGRLDLVINTAAVLHLPDRKMVPETSIQRFDGDAATLSYRTNTIGPMLMTKHFMKLMLKTADENAKLEEGERQQVPIIASLSARVSSIADNKLGGWYSYRGSKTALNQMTQTAHVEFSRKKNPIAMLLLHPGTVDTELSEPFKKNVPPEKLFTPEFSATKMLEVLDKVTLKDSGKFYDYAGVEIPW
jgi:NAD(P)-dependent dehydrogenase (short-subunit alcohol dehydrogenase family)